MIKLGNKTGLKGTAFTKMGQVSQAPDEQLRYHLHKQLAGSQPGRSHKRVHASALTKTDAEFCPREYALMDKLKKQPANEFLSTSTNVTFMMGRVLQDYVVNTFADIGQAVGNWKCVVCGTVEEFSKRPAACKTCKCTAFAPEEYRFESALNGVSCGIDMLWNYEKNFHTIVEIKTMDKDMFKTLVAPLAEHKLRTNMYMRIVSESADPMRLRVKTDTAKILYISKGGFGCQDEQVAKWGFPDNKFSPFKEFTVTRDDSQTDFYMEKAERLLKFRNGEAGIPCQICKTSYTQRASKCGVIKECFSGNYPSTE